MFSADATNTSSVLASDCDHRFRRLLEHLPTAAYTCDREGLITYCNQRATELWQRTPALNDPADRYCGAAQLLLPDGTVVPHDQSWMARALQENREYNGKEIVVGCPDGSRAEVRVHAQPYQDQAGNVAGSVVMLVDVTEERKTEERLKQAARTEAVAKLISGLSHEFNNLLTVIGGCAEFALLTTEPEDPNHEVLSEIATSIEKASLLTNQLLAACKKQIIQPRAVHLDDLVRRTGPLLRRIVGDGIQVRNSLKATDCFTKVDPGQLEQVLLSLAVHAQAAMPHGGTFSLQTRCATFTQADCQKSPETKPGTFIVLSLSEDGTFVSPNAVPDRGPPYFGCSPPASGTDLGMTVVQEFVRKSGGFATASREAPCGSTYNICLPITEPPSLPASPEAHPANTLDGNETVLVVEDDVAVRATICRSLSKRGYRVLQAGDGKEALQVAHAHEGVRLVISDVVMPEMSGHQLAVKLAALNPAIKIMFMSGYSEDAVFCKIVGEQNVAFLQKPFSPTDVAKSVRDLLGRDSLGNASSAASSKSLSGASLWDSPAPTPNRFAVPGRKECSTSPITTGSGEFRCTTTDGCSNS